MTYERFMVGCAIATTVVMMVCIIAANIKYWGVRLYEVTAWLLGAGMILNSLFMLEAVAIGSDDRPPAQTDRYLSGVLTMLAVSMLAFLLAGILRRRRLDEQSKSTGDCQPITDGFRR